LLGGRRSGDGLILTLSTPLLVYVIHLVIAIFLTAIV
jgi:hypothetical protein